MSVIYQQRLKQVLLKHCDYIASSLEVVGSGSNEPVYCGLNEPLAGLVRFYYKPSVTDFDKRNVSYISSWFKASVMQAL